MDTDNLPIWDLNELYTGLEDLNIIQDKSLIYKNSIAFESLYKGRIMTLSPYELGQGLCMYETITEKMAKLSCYAALQFRINTTDSKWGQFYSEMDTVCTEISKLIQFFTLELACLPKEHTQTLIDQDETVKRYAHWIYHSQSYHPHNLNSDLERLILDKNLSAHSAWIRLYDTILGSFTSEYEGMPCTLQSLTHKMGAHDAQVRKKAAISLGAGLEVHSSTITLIANTIIQDQILEGKWRSYTRPDAARHLDNQVDAKVIDALCASVKSYYPKLTHRYYALKKKVLGLAPFSYWDRNAPLVMTEDAEQSISFIDAQEIVLSAYGAFSPTLRSIGAHFFERGWIDAKPRQGKDSGAFSCFTTPTHHPYILMNYEGKVRDVMTLAHELGHGIHQVLSAPNGQLMADAPLILAETASVFGEMLTFQYLLSRTQNPKERLTLLASKIDDMLNTVVRQISFYEFEKTIYTLRAEKELSSDDITAVWMDVLSESLGASVSLDASVIGSYWMYISHFFHSPFYVYSYAFGDCLVNSLFGLYLQKPDGFEENYLTLLKSGGSKPYDLVLAQFGLDPQKPDFWTIGLEAISTLIDTFESALVEVHTIVMPIKVVLY